MRAKNGASVYGNTATVTTAQTGGGNNTEGGGEGGVIVDETAAPAISNVAISGKLAVGEALSGSYTFDAKTGNPADTSEYQWGVEGSTGSAVENGTGKAISQSGVVPSYTIVSSDAGQVLEMSVRAKNGASVYGNTATVTTAQTGGGNNTTGGNNGTVVIVANSFSVSLSKTKVQIGQPISMTLKALDEKGAPVKGVSFNVMLDGATNRQNESETATMMFNGQSSATFITPETDSTGQVIVTLTDPNGRGVETKFSVTTDDLASKTQSVIFTVLTSPDSQYANYWGHMVNSFKLSTGGTIERPKLSGEVINGNTGLKFNREPYSGMIKGEVNNSQLPRTSEFDELYKATINNGVSSLGWPVGNYLYSDSPDNSAYNLAKGQVKDNYAGALVAEKKN